MPSFCTVAAHVIVSPKPPSARLTSQRYSSSPRLPSSWLWPLVIGARTNRFVSVPPRVRESESVSCVMGINCIGRSPCSHLQRLTLAQKPTTERTEIHGGHGSQHAC